MTSDRFAAAELARLCAAKNVRHAVISPGSRNAPLVIAFTANEAIRCLQVIDERSAAFFALGMAQQLGAPVALICTSGSAVLNYGPAIAEAFYQRVPLLAITADRPMEWTDQGEGQAIRQQGVLALHMRRSVQLPRSLDDPLSRWYCGRLINEAIDATLLPVPGPVHINVPFDEPLYGTTGRHEHGTRIIEQVPIEHRLPQATAGLLAREISGTQRVMVLAGQGTWDEPSKAGLRHLASLPQCVVLAEATSNLDGVASVPCIDRTIEGLGDTADHDLRPDLLITFGGDVVSKRIKALLRNWRPQRHWHVDVEQRHHDTHQSLTHAIAVHPAAFLEQVAAHTSALDSGYAARWGTRARDAAARHTAFLAQAPWCDLTAFASILRALPAGSDVHLANSTPARYAQLVDRDPSLRWFANRGTSGIDGCVSTAVGAACATQRPTTLICGETAFLYDSNAFWNAHLPPCLRVIVMDNGGGNIFRYIPGPDHHPELLPWFEAPHGRDPALLARSLGLPTYEAGDGASLQGALRALHAPHDRPAVLVVRTAPEVSPRVLRDYFAALRG